MCRCFSTEIVALGFSGAARRRKRKMVGPVFLYIYIFSPGSNASEEDGRHMVIIEANKDPSLVMEVQQGTIA